TTSVSRRRCPGVGGRPCDSARAESRSGGRARVIVHFAALLAALPWMLVPLATIVRARRSRTLAEERSEPPAPAPLVSVIVPARNEQRNIARCITSVLA